MFSTSLKSGESIHFTNILTENKHYIRFMGLEQPYAEAKCEAVFEVDGEKLIYPLDESFYIGDNAEILIIIKKYDRAYLRCAVDSDKAWVYSIR